MMALPELGLGLALTLGKEGHDESKYDDIRAIQEDTIEVKYLLPDESVVTHQFKKGQTVAVLKGFLADELELNPADLQLRLEDRVMLDPLSLTDFDTITQASSIDVEVRICSSNNTQQHRK